MFSYARFHFRLPESRGLQDLTTTWQTEGAAVGSTSIIERQVKEKKDIFCFYCGVLHYTNILLNIKL